MMQRADVAIMAQGVHWPQAIGGQILQNGIGGGQLLLILLRQIKRTVTHHAINPATG